MEKRNGFFGQLCFLVLMGVLFLCHDVWQVATDNVNLNRHLPFLMPIFFALMTGIVLRCKWHVEGKKEPE